MKVIFANEHYEHVPEFFLTRGKVIQSTERPERAEILINAAKGAGLEPLEATEFQRSHLLRVHSVDYLRFLEDAASDWAALADAGPEIVANVHPSRIAGTYPRSIVGRAGWHTSDTACPIGPHTFKAACRSADVALTGAELLLSGSRSAYAFCRPPGHHASTSSAGGFCYLNNSAIAAAHLHDRSLGRVAILDIDVHHGNGTQAIFYETQELTTVSIHTDPGDYYPFFWGHAHERGSGAGEGANLNIPLPLGTGDEPWLTAINQALAYIRAAAPTFLVVALGLDAHEKDPLQGMFVTTPAFGEAGKRIAAFGLPTLIVQEGGYLSPALGDNLRRFLEGFQSA